MKSSGHHGAVARDACFWDAERIPKPEGPPTSYLDTRSELIIRPPPPVSMWMNLTDMVLRKPITKDKSCRIPCT